MLLLQVLLAMRTLLGIGLAGTTIGDTLFLEVIPKSQRGRWMMALGLFWVRDVWGGSGGWSRGGWRWRKLLSGDQTKLNADA